jgi:hypothetical protein
MAQMSCGRVGTMVVFVRFMPDGFGPLAGAALFSALGVVAFCPIAGAAEIGSTPIAQSFAQSAPIPDVPGDDIFGFTSATDPGKVGDAQFFSENDGRAGKRNGRYAALNSKFAAGYTFVENWWIGLGFFGAYNRSVDVVGLTDVDHWTFDGLSIELLHRIIERSVANPFAVTLSIEPRWGRVDGVTGLRSDSYGVTYKFLTDAVVVPDKFYWAGNVQFTSQWAQDPLNTASLLGSSLLSVSSALSYQASTSVFLGAEARYFIASDTTTLSHEVGRALYIGPTLWWRLTEKAAINVTYQPQVYGRSVANPDRALDLDNFERAQFRMKLNVAL